MLKNKWSDLYGTGVAPAVIDNAGGYRDIVTGAAGAGKPDIDRSMAGELIAVRPGVTADAPLLFSAEKGGSTPETANDSIYVIVFIPDIIGQADPSIKIPLQGLAASSDGGDFLIPGAMLYVVNAPGQGWLIHYRMVNTLADDAGDNQEKIDGAEFLALSAAQAPFDLDTVDVDAINAIVARPTKNGQKNYVAPLGSTGLLFFAPPKAQLKVRGEEMIFTPETLQNQAVFFVPDPDFKDPDDGKPVQIHGVAIQCSGYFRLIVSDQAVKGEPFSAIELDSGHNTGVVGSGRVYPPGGYIFHLDGSEAVGLDMMDRYDLGGDVVLSQPAGYKAMYVELYRTAVPELYMALYSGQDVQIVNLDNNSVAPTNDVGSLQSQELLTTDRLRTILINLLSAASKDPTGEGYAYLPWKYERWYKKEGGAADWNLGSADVAKLNAAVRSKNPVTGRELFAGTFVTAPRTMLAPNLSLYAEQDVALYNGNNDDGTPTVGIKIDSNAPKTKTITVLSGRDTLFGVADIYLKATTPFSFRFTDPQDPDQTIGLKVVRAYDTTEKTTLLLIDGENYSIEDSIFPVGEYIFRSYEKAGFVLSVLAATNLKGKGAIAMPGAGVEITRLRQTSGREYYNAWFETAGVPKIVNSVDSNDQPKTLGGLIQSEPVEIEDLETLESRLNLRIEQLQTFINNTSVWKIEEWIGDADQVRPLPLMPATNTKTADFGYGVTGNAVTPGNPSFQIVDYGLIYRDSNITVGEKLFFVKQTIEPYLSQIYISATQDITLSFQMIGGDPGTHTGVPVAYDANATKGIAVFDPKGNLLSVSDLAKPLPSAKYLIQMGRPVDIIANYTPAKPPKYAFVLNVVDPRSKGTPTPFSVVYGLDGKIKSIVNMNDVTDRRDNLDGMRPVPKPIDEEIAIEKLGTDGKQITVDQLHDDLKSQLDSMERSAGYLDLGTLSGPTSIDWSTGKYNRKITLGGDLTITMPNPPPSPQFLEIMIMNPAGDYKLTGVTAPQKLVKPIGEQSVNQKAPLWIKLFWDGTQYYTDVEDL